MAIIESSFSEFNEKQPQQPQPQPQPNATAVDYNTPESKRGKGLLNLPKRSVSYNPMGYSLQSYFKTLERILEGIDATNLIEHKFVLSTFDGASNQVRANAILVSLVTDKQAVVYPLLVATAIQALPDKVYNLQGLGAVSVPQLPEELLSSTTVVNHAIRGFVKSRFTNREVTVVDGLVLPESLNPEDEVQLERVLARAIDTLEYSYQRLIGRPDRFTIIQKEPDQRLVIRQDFNGQPTATSTGLPLRNDLAVKMTVEKGNNNNSPDAFGREESSYFSTAQVHFELMWTGPQGFQQLNPYTQPVPGPIFQPYAIINSLNNEFFGATLETQLLSLTSVASIVMSGNWINVYKPNMALGTEYGSDPKDIGAITLDENLPGQKPAYCKTKEPGFNLLQFMQQYVNGSVIFQIDVPELGDLTYIQKIFLEASGATGDDSVTQRANSTIIDAANYLTDGAFSNYWNLGESIFVEEVGRVELGYYIDEKGNKRDLHEWDYLRFLNLVGLEAARQYSESINPNFGSDVYRFDKRRRLYDTYVPGYVITGFARRLTINSNFLVALDAAIKASGGPIEIVTHVFGQPTQQRAYINQFSGLNAQQLTGFRQGGFGFGQQNQQNVSWRNYNPGYNGFGRY